MSGSGGGARRRGCIRFAFRTSHWRGRRGRAGGGWLVSSSRLPGASFSAGRRRLVSRRCGCIRLSSLVVLFLLRRRRRWTCRRRRRGGRRARCAGRHAEEGSGHSYGRVGQAGRVSRQRTWKYRCRRDLAPPDACRMREGEGRRGETRSSPDDRIRSPLAWPLQYPHEFDALARVADAADFRSCEHRRGRRRRGGEIGEQASQRGIDRNERHRRRALARACLPSSLVPRCVHTRVPLSVRRRHADQPKRPKVDPLAARAAAFTSASTGARWEETAAGLRPGVGLGCDEAAGGPAQRIDLSGPSGAVRASRMPAALGRHAPQMDSARVLIRTRVSVGWSVWLCRVLTRSCAGDASSITPIDTRALRRPSPSWLLPRPRPLLPPRRRVAAVRTTSSAWVARSASTA